MTCRPPWLIGYWLSMEISAYFGEGRKVSDRGTKPGTFLLGENSTSCHKPCINNQEQSLFSRLFVHLPGEEIWSSWLHETVIYTLWTASAAHGSFYGCRQAWLMARREFSGGSHEVKGRISSGCMESAPVSMEKWKVPLMSQLRMSHDLTYSFTDPEATVGEFLKSQSIITRLSSSQQPRRFCFSPPHSSVWEIRALGGGGLSCNLRHH